MFFLDKFQQGLRPQYDDDVIDRLNYYYTPMMLIAFALTLSAKQYVGQPIQCWPPAQFTGAWEQYSENYCFVQNTYFLPLTHYIPQDIAQREDREIGYYQWVPFVLGIQAILFFLPSLLWRILHWQSGISVKGIIQMCEDVGNMHIEKRKNSVEIVATHLRDSLRTQRQLSERFLVAPLFARGSYLVVLYLFVKLVYLVQVLGQFVILNNFLGTSYTLWGFEILRDLAYGREWQESGHFPRVTMCDFDIRVLGNKHRHTLQCVLMINMFNEKIYLFIWWWFLAVAIATIVNFAYWFSFITSERQQEAFITQYLRIYQILNNDPQEQTAICKFVHVHLQNDGVFLMRLVASNAGDLITTDVVFHLWRQFLLDEAARAETLPLGEPKHRAADVSAPPPIGLDNVDGEKQRLT